MYERNQHVQIPHLGVIHTEELALFQGEVLVRWESTREFGGFLFHVEDGHAVCDRNIGQISPRVRLVLELAADNYAKEAA